MPTYDYVCLQCGKEFEYSQPMKDEPLSRCIFDGCKGEVRRRVGAGAGLIFKGSGFYATDYKHNGNGHSKSDKSSSEPTCPAAGDSAKCASCPANASKD